MIKIYLTIYVYFRKLKDDIYLNELYSIRIVLKIIQCENISKTKIIYIHIFRIDLFFKKLEKSF